jgi:hypothetical protein
MPRAESTTTYRSTIGSSVSYADCSRRESTSAVIRPRQNIFDPGFIVPDFVVELLVALWLIFKGAKIGTADRKNSDNDTA